MEKENFKLGELILLEKLPVEKKRNSKGGWNYSYKGRYRCFCGKEFVTKTIYVRTGDTKSCGCYNAYKIKNNVNYIDGRARTRLNNIYKSIIRRTTDEKDKSYPYYGGKGIRMCEEWLQDFSLFKIWAEENGYKEDLTIDRINSNGNYSPDNCRWATRLQQSTNLPKRNNTVSKYKGVTPKDNRWRARVYYKRKLVLDKYFLTEKEAALAYNEAALKHHGEFACLNVIDSERSGNS